MAEQRPPPAGADLSAENASLREEAETTKLILDSIADAVMVLDEKGEVALANAAARAFAVDNEPRRWDEPGIAFRPDGVTPYPIQEFPISRALRGQTVLNEVLVLRGDRSPDGAWIQVDALPIRAEDGAIRGAVAIFRDITERRRHEEQMWRRLVREKEKNDLLERMRTAIEQLSTPILEVWDGVLAIPVIGVIDSMRAADMTARALEAVERKECRFLIIDITGIDIIDTATAGRFMTLVTAVEILGARCFLTGARAVVAQTLASLGMDLKGLTTLRTMKHGLAECIRAMDETSKRPQLRDLLLRAAQRRE